MGPDSLLTLEFEYHFYDWDNGKSVNIHGVVITDRFMGEFHRQGLAQAVKGGSTVSATEDVEKLGRDLA